jgi:hypothetical protein
MQLTLWKAKKLKEKNQSPFKTFILWVFSFSASYLNVFDHRACAVCDLRSSLTRMQSSGLHTKKAILERK